MNKEAPCKDTLEDILAKADLNANEKIYHLLDLGYGVEEILEAALQFQK